MTAALDKAVLIIIDVQKGFDSPYWGARNNPQAEKNISKLLKFWRETSRPIVHVRHMSVEPNSPLRPGQSGNEFKDEVLPIKGEHVEEKTVNSAFIGTGLEQYLRKNNFDTVVIAGLTTDHCVSTSTRMAGNLGFKTYVVADATATFDRTSNDGKHYSADDVHAYALASLNQEFATVLNTKDLLVAT
jgi:nicotinamidase-related amidase